MLDGGTDRPAVPIHRGMLSEGSPVELLKHALGILRSLDERVSPSRIGTSVYRHPLSDEEAREVITVLQRAGISNKVIRDVLADLGYHPDDSAYGSQGAYQFLDKTWADPPVDDV